MIFFKTPRFLQILLFKRTWSFFSKENSIYLTFDDGPHPDITPWVLDELRKHSIKATFFCVGNNVKKYPEIYNQILKEGHSVGNHTMNHDRSKELSLNDYLHSIHETDTYIQSNLFRPPYGNLNPLRARIISKEKKIIMWSWLAYDFDESISINKILSKANKQIKKGDIIVLHDNPKFAKRQKELLPKLIRLLKDKKLDFKPIKHTI